MTSGDPAEQPGSPTSSEAKRENTVSPEADAVGQENGPSNASGRSLQIRQVPPGTIPCPSLHALSLSLSLSVLPKRCRFRRPREAEPQPGSPGAGELPRGADHALLPRLLRFLPRTAFSPQKTLPNEATTTTHAARSCFLLQNFLQLITITTNTAPRLATFVFLTLFSLFAFSLSLSLITNYYQCSYKTTKITTY